MKAHENISNQRDLLLEEIEAIFLLVDQIPYSIMLQIIGLNGVMDKSNDKDTLTKIATEMGITQDSLQAMNILYRITQFNQRMFEACTAVIIEEQKQAKPVAKLTDDALSPMKEPVALGADDLFPMLTELIKRNHGENKAALLKMHDFCNRLSIDIAKATREEGLTQMQLAHFLAATRHISGADDLLYIEDDDEEDKDVSLAKDDPKKKKQQEQEIQEINKKIDSMEKLAAVKPLNTVSEVKIEQIEQLAKKFIESDQNELLGCYRNLCSALKEDKEDIPKAINLLSELGKWSAGRNIEQLLLIGVPIDETLPINLVVVIDHLSRAKKIYTDPLLIAGCQTVKALVNSRRFDQAAQAVRRQQDKFADDTQRVCEALLVWDNENRRIEVASEDQNSEHSEFNPLKEAIQALKKEADHFEDLNDKLRVVNLANELHRVLNEFIASAVFTEEKMQEMKNEFKDTIAAAGLLVQPLTFREKISHIFLMVAHRIKEKMTDTREFRYKFYSAKKQLSDKVSSVEKIIKQSKPANDAISRSPTRASGKR